MDLAPARLCARERMDSALQGAVRPRSAGNRAQRESVSAGKGRGNQASVPAVWAAVTGRQPSPRLGLRRRLNEIRTCSLGARCRLGNFAGTSR